MDEIIYDDFGFLGSWVKQYDLLPTDELKKEFVECIFNFASKGQEPDKEKTNPIILALMESVIKQVKTYKTLRNNAQGRPEEYPLEIFIPYFEKGVSRNVIARDIGCSTKTIDRKRKEWEKACEEKEEVSETVIPLPQQQPPRDNSYEDLMMQARMIEVRR